MPMLHRTFRGYVFAKSLRMRARRVFLVPALAESPRNIILGSAFTWIRKHFASGGEFHQSAKIKESGHVGTTPGLLHIMSNDDDGVFRFQLIDELLDLGSRNWIQRGAWFVH